MKVALAGDLILNRRVSVREDPGFLSLVEEFRGADLAVGHLDSTIHDFEGPGVHPAAEAGGTWMRSPPGVADDLDWMGFDAITLPSNHALDYGHGGLRETWRALEGAGLAYAGAGPNLGAARSPTYLDTPEGRVGIVSMASTFPRWGRAGEARRDMPGRPGVNPLRYHHAVEPGTLDAMREAAERLGWWIVREGDAWLFHPPGLHNSTRRVVEADGDPGPVLHERDREGNLRAVREAADRADLAVVHLHTHEHDPDGDLSDPAPFVPPFARECIDAGADVFLAQGSHSPLRGIEVYEGRPILYDPGSFFMMSTTVERLPHDFYVQYADALDVHPADATPGEALAARGETYVDAVNPPGGYHSGSVEGTTVPVCSFDAGGLSRLEVHPATWPGGHHMDRRGGPTADVGVPERATGEAAERIVAAIDDLSEPFGTGVAFEDGVGVVDPG